MSVFDIGSGKNTITIQQAIMYAQNAGFSGENLVTAVAIAMAESGLDTNSANTTTSGIGIDRGIVKFNSVFHSEVSDQCAYDPACAFKEFFRVSQNGTNFCEWCTYNANCAHPCNSNGPYKNNLAAVRTAIGGDTTLTGTPVIGTTGTTSYGLPTGLLNWVSDPVRTIKMLVGIALIGLSLYMLVVPGAPTTVSSFAKKIRGKVQHV